MPALSNGAIPDELEQHDDRLRALEVDVGKLTVTVEAIRNDLDDVKRAVSKMSESIDGKLDKLRESLDAQTTAERAFFDRVDARIAPLEKSLTSLNADVEIAKKVGAVGLSKLWPILVAVAVGFGAGGPLVDALKHLSLSP